MVDFTITTIASPNTAGSVLPESRSYPSGTIVPLSGVPNAGFIFSEWQGDLTGSTNPITITLDADKTISGIFLAQTYNRIYTRIDIT